MGNKHVNVTELLHPYRWKCRWYRVTGYMRNNWLCLSHNLYVSFGGCLFVGLVPLVLLIPQGHRFLETGVFWSCVAGLPGVYCRLKRVFWRHLYSFTALCFSLALVLKSPITVLEELELLIAFDWEVVVLTDSWCYGYLMGNIIVVDNTKVSALHFVSIK